MKDSRYMEFIRRKEISSVSAGFESDKSTYNEHLFDWQRDIVHWALKKGRACLFEDCGLGKTLQQLSFSEEVVKHTGKPVIIVAPLAVASQTKREGEKFGIELKDTYYAQAEKNAKATVQTEQLPLI